jgi:RNA polymerase sigma factor (sigma-70 family)
MARGINGVVIGQLRTLFELGAVGSMTDGELLDRYLEDRDESGQSAFRVLVDRHGPMVFGVCRASLKASHDSEDAFQATFLVLAKNARSIRNRESIAPWLFGVARKVSARASGIASRRQRLERGQVDAEEVSVSAEPSNLGQVEDLIAEVDRLPRRLRDPLVLCYWQGMTYDESAEVLGLTEGAIRGRLARARDLLRARLVRKGISPETMVSGAFALPSFRPVPLRLIEPTIRAAVSQSASGIVPASVISLSQGAWPMILTAKWKLSAAVTLAVVAILSIGPTVVAWQKPPRPLQGDRSLIAGPVPGVQQSHHGGVSEDASLASKVGGKIVRSDEVLKDCMVLSYLPDWRFGKVDNIGVEGHDGGVRTLVNCADLAPSEAESPHLKFYLAFFARKAVESPDPARKFHLDRGNKDLVPIRRGTLTALAVSGDWPEETSWTMRPLTEPDVIGTYSFEPGEGWKTFDITSFVREKRGRLGYGLMLRYVNEDRPGTEDWTGYQFVSREGTDKWAGKRPRLLVVDISKK